MVDVAIIGAGVVGCSIARELSKYSITVSVIEKDSDVSNGTSKANSGIVHGGYDSKFGTLKGSLCVQGNSMFKDLNDQLHFGFNKCGSFVLAFSSDDMVELHHLYENGKKNGIKNLEIVDREFVLKKEPNINQEVVGALYCADAGVISPWEYAIAMAENAALNGVSFLLNNKVTSIAKKENHFTIQTDKNTINTRYIINCAGLYSDEISNMVGVNRFKIRPRKGEYILFDKEYSGLTNSILFQTPNNGSKGVLVTPTYHGNMMIGPNAEYICDKEDTSTTSQGLATLQHKVQKTLKSIDYSKAITQFSGLRAATDTYDFIIEESQVKQFINVGAIDSPGLTSSPAIAVMVSKLLLNAGLKLKKDHTFNPNLTPIIKVNELNIHDKNKLIKKDPRYGRVICRCESMTQGEIVEALHRPIPATTLDAVKRRARAGAGRCQGGFCSPRVMEIINEELDLPVLDINKSEDKSNILIDKTKKSMEVHL
ncbi:FAD-dependent oxidoreductase [Alkalibaculum sp. M08DMB]|uniref:FAD-dependent oxidoreductase n=1 Tax=Alkalibaculum sporogenes TaxID=2655001 RepID=A0A6A7K8Z5_9FIRM|nr:NAD(P)/FAD-dependent oxidoreductase [Alkalibaculum sporogenes]MPW25894.1 FAD-dependent oxidoreductase [Alkalibaculum sporogenes]